uniref:Uncharacterized protein n=1 Tax=Callorhinchus milii TaxID=7868 RepID=A0A4W3JXM6_CALMI
MVGRAGAGTGAVATGICVALFVAYCVYFDRKRRRDPELKVKLRERRRRRRRRQREEEGCATPNPSRYPDPSHLQAGRAFFLEGLELGEGSLAQGDVQVGVEDLSNIGGQGGKFRWGFKASITIASSALPG